MGQPLKVINAQITSIPIIFAQILLYQLPNRGDSEVMGTAYSTSALYLMLNECVGNFDAQERPPPKIACTQVVQWLASYNEIIPRLEIRFVWADISAAFCEPLLILKVFTVDSSRAQ
ncbi:hypothetical protein [Halioxenophilus aromaticivorans]|uniref:Uncharacterized protein n=1 Tax=Halioxenophilus aromaticivorans TaxID=1306992 RepID=A0AAV3TXY6_9ALTE